MTCLKIKIVGGIKFFLYFPLKIQKKLNIPFGELVKITLKKKDKTHKILTKYNYNITLKKEVIKKLDLSKGDIIDVLLEKPPLTKRPLFPFFRHKADLLFFLPERNKKGSNIYFETELIGSEEVIRIESIHQRGSSSQIVLRRYLDPKLFGLFLGQMQAEGTKTNHDALEFCNKSLFELKDFINFLDYLGLSKDKLCVKMDYHIKFKKDLDEISKNFEKVLGIKINYFSGSDKNGGGYGFKIIVRSTILSELFLNALVNMRNYLLTLDFSGVIRLFFESYLAKILSGDGSFELTSKKRKKIQSRLTIADGNLDYLNHYKILLEKFGFHPRIYPRFQFIRALCNLEQAKKLLEISAFDNNPNQKKILFFIENNEASAR